MEGYFKYGILFVGLLFVIWCGILLYKHVKYKPTDNFLENINIENLYFQFVNRDSKLTLPEKEQQFKIYQNRTGIFSGTVKSIEISSTRSYIVYLSAPEDHNLNMAKIYFLESENYQVSQLSKNNQIVFSGTITDYNPSLGIIIKKAKLISPEFS